MRDRRVLAAFLVVLMVAATVASAALASAKTGRSSGVQSAAVARSASIVATDYDLGVRGFRQPGLTGRFATMPIRLWGTIAAPTSRGPHPIVLIAHGAHGDNCPLSGDVDTWPCWTTEQRNDLGFRYLVRALARAGVVAVAMDTNAAYTGGWGELPNKEQLRFGQVLDATIAELKRANAGNRTKLGLNLTGRLNLSRLGLLGHSRGGMNVLRWGKTKRPDAVFLVAPFFDPAQKLPNAPSTVLVGTCDFDTRQAGRGYVRAAAAQARTTPVVEITLARANHNYYNQTLVAARKDDAEGQQGVCAPGSHLTGKAQQDFLARVTADHFESSLVGAEPAAWLTRPVQGSLYGQKILVRRITP